MNWFPQARFGRDAWNLRGGWILGRRCLKPASPSNRLSV